eukprot:363736-Chlamydomonas_euryale.AAC.14
MMTWRVTSRHAASRCVWAGVHTFEQGGPCGQGAGWVLRQSLSVASMYTSVMPWAQCGSWSDSFGKAADVEPSSSV